MESEFLADHVDCLLAENDLIVAKWLKRPGWNSTDLDGDDLRIAEIRCEETYCSALHEIGHIKLQTKDEVAAWIWARENAVYWSDDMDDVMFDCLNKYGFCAAS